ncbi:polysaccharide biosynthesis C-terminal domain-containing protein [Flavobacteriales bacterium]|nr:polysaccharide biosynthesis C-terminal domain-containing protein [Flavobacteriales bacterium]MDC1370707.1 polysaccharide biosynthesis C-terminal domain-containing protein [Flavobacteriales bacterium]
MKPFYILGIDAEIQNRVGAEDYGMYFSLLGFTFLFTIFLDVGIVNFTTRTISQQPFLIQKYFSKVFSLRIFLALIYGVLVLIIGGIIGYNQSEIYLLLWLIFNQILAGFTLYFRSNLTGLLLFKYDSIVSVLDRFLLIIICSILLWGGVTTEPFQIYWFVYAQTFAYGVSAITALIFLLSNQKLKKLNWDKLFSMAILRQSAPYALLILLMTFYYRADSVMLERMLEDGKTQAGIYANGFRFFEAANNIAFLFASLLLPLFSNLLKNKKPVTSLVKIASSILIPGAILVAITCFLFSQQLIDARYINSTFQSGQVFGILMICFVFISTTYIFGTLLTANGNLKTLNKIAFGGVVLNIILNLILIPKYQAYGAAIASLITQGLTTIAQVWLCKSYFNLKMNSSLITRGFIFTAICLALGVILNQEYFNFIPWYGLMAILFFSGILFLFVLQIVEIKNVKKLFQKTS